eukprot:TRINITY_DN1877_c0_g1_i1.p1 TRINITY_DN1877_c0_g1~~TRINITY_DN1877_c0_g1_i1.p1  ORF type:complete len:309 (+),score=54.94 TRINITY_DN1877_c0_g1_i1:601-1527(+)
MRYTSFIHGENLTDVTITGEQGVIDGQGFQWWVAHLNGTLNYTRPHLIEFLYCSNLEISNLTLLNSPFWNVHPYDSDGVVVRDLVIRAPGDSPNTDGIDPDSCSNVLIENIDYFGGDDGIAIKSGWDCFGYGYNHSTRNVVVRNMKSGPKNCMVIGSEMSGGIANVTFENINCTGNKRGIYIKTSSVRGGYVKDITFRNVSFAELLFSTLVVDFHYGDPNPSCPSNVTMLPTVDNIAFVDITSLFRNRPAENNTNPPGRFRGVELSWITRVTLQNVQLQPSQAPWTCEYVEGRSVNVQPTPCPQLLGA